MRKRIMKDVEGCKILVLHWNLDSNASLLVKGILADADLLNVSIKDVDSGNYIKSVLEHHEVEAIVIVAPVYNASYPGELKTLLDSVDRSYLRDVPVAGVIYAGGDRYAQTWVTTYYPWLLAIGMKVLPDNIYTHPGMEDSFIYEDWNEFEDDDESYLRLQSHFESVVVSPFIDGLVRAIESK